MKNKRNIRKMKNGSIISGLLACIMIVSFSCDKMDDEYKKYAVPGGITYPQKPVNATAHSGDHRVVLRWGKGNDPSIAKAIVTWNVNEGSREFNIDGNKEDIEIEIDDLDEKDYSFIVKTFDGNGNSSVPVELNSLAYGDSYKSSIYNRTLNLAYIDVDKLVLEWNPADISNGMKYTELYYMNKSGEEKMLKIEAASNDKNIIEDYKLGTDIRHMSFFVPDTTCVDTFETPFEVNTPLEAVDRSGWTITASSYEEHGQTGYGGANPERVLDGLIENTPNAGPVATYWHSQHSGNAPGYPHWLAVDMKKPINIKRVILQPRNDKNGQGFSFSNFIIQGSNDGVQWTDLETYEIADKKETAPQYFPVYAKEYYSHFRIMMTKAFDNGKYAHLSELSILGVEQ